MSPKHSFPIALLAILALGTTANAAIEDLRITRVDPLNDAVSVTNTGADPFTAVSNLPFCHLFNYASVIPSGTTFAAGETKQFAVAGLSDTASDIWLYRDSNFPSSASILTGMQYGAGNQGRTSVAVAAAIWNNSADFAPSPAAGQFLLFTGSDATLAASWTLQTNASVEGWILY